MPIMRRGPLDRYPVEWVLRQASLQETSGTIEFNSSRPITVFLRGGKVYQAVRGIGDGVDPGVTPARATDPVAARDLVVQLLVETMAGEGGWYFHDPLGHLDDQTSWAWDVHTLLGEAHTFRHERAAYGGWAAIRVAPQARANRSPITLGPDAWSVVAHLTVAQPSPAIAEALGWEPSRLIEALDELQRTGALGALPTVARPDSAPDEAIFLDAPTAPEVVDVTEATTRPPAGLTPSIFARRADARPQHPGPLAPRPGAPALAPAGGVPAREVAVGGADDRRSALRRLISTLRPT